MPIKKAKEPKAPKEKKVKVPKEKKVKAPKEKKPKKVKPPKAKKVKKGKNAPEEVEGLEEGQQPKKKLPLPLLLISLAVIIAAAVIVFLFVIRPRLGGNADEDPDATASVEPEPPVLPTEIPIGDDVSIVGMALEADESGAQAEKAKTITYTYTNLNNAGKAAETYAAQLAKESPSFSVVDEEFVRQTDAPDYSADEGMVLLARNAPVVKKEDEADTEETKAAALEDLQSAAQGILLGGGSGFSAGLLEPLPVPEEEEPITYVHTVRITWSPGECVVTADEEVGKVTAPPNNTVPAGQALSIRGAQNRMREMAPIQLGLEGQSMDEYEMIPMDATELVNGVACIRINVYNGSGAASPNEYRGSYLMSVDGLHMYRLDTGTNEIVELEDYP